ncbi:hypothetical protein O2V63_11815 [Modestobacter sp. VKM Ac-2977]|uniref:hypothetical protein n=1 Tax=Modestobacter sp. VKM Ac-2977 TaxID=3004131 RepID=UPI0022AA2724|nr:hypothetical protein [Modestobacter sp. VKM Ac-2977]MCZ2821018.1 hypothetical protein [Modestobacter sp. VKM Ac-2977]
MLATTDVHGRAQDWDYFRDAPYTDSAGDATGLARVSSVVDSVRAEKGADSVFVVDNGDFLQGTPLTYLAAQKPPEAEHPIAAAYDVIGYDAQVVGNHEFNYGLDTLAGYVDDVDHPVLGANVIDVETGEPYLPPYTLERMEVRGAKPVTVGIIGLTTPGSAIWDRNNVEGQLEFRDMVETAEEWVPVVAEQADVVVVLAHAGSAGRRPTTTRPSARRTPPTSSPARCPASTRWSSATRTATPRPRSWSTRSPARRCCSPSPTAGAPRSARSTSS